jgi:hypothetical protein
MFYLAADGTVMQLDVNTSTGFQAVALHALFKLPAGATSFDNTVDGKRFLVGVPVEQDAQTPFTVALSWEEGLKR